MAAVIGRRQAAIRELLIMSSSIAACARWAPEETGLSGERHFSTCHVVEAIRGFTNVL